MCVACASVVAALLSEMSGDVERTGSSSAAMDARRAKRGSDSGIVDLIMTSDKGKR